MNRRQLLTGLGTLGLAAASRSAAASTRLTMQLDWKFNNKFKLVLAGRADDTAGVDERTCEPGGPAGSGATAL